MAEINYDNDNLTGFDSFGQTHAPYVNEDHMDDMSLFSKLDDKEREGFNTNDIIKNNTPIEDKSYDSDSSDAKIEKFSENFNNNVFDIYRYAKHNNILSQTPEYIHDYDKELLIKHQPIVYADADDSFRLVNPNYYLEFTQILFNPTITGYIARGAENDYKYLCYNLFYESERTVKTIKSEMYDQEMKQYEGDLFNVILIVVKIDIDSKITEVCLSANLKEDSYIWIKSPCDPITENDKVQIYLSQRYVYLINDSIDRYENFISYNDEKLVKTKELPMQFEPLCISKLNRNINEQWVKYEQISDITTIINKPSINKYELIWTKKEPKYSWIPSWLYNVLPNCLGKYLFKDIKII